MSWKMRRRLAIVILLVLLPAWIVAATTLVGLFERPHILLELGIYVALGIVWALPFRWVFRGIGRPAPEDEQAGQGPP